MLKDDGRLIVTVPFFNDWETGHMRIHSPLSIERLIAMGGFKTADYIERPALVRPDAFNALQHGASLVAYRLRGRTSYATSNRIIGALSWRLGHVRALGPIRRMGKGYGAYLLCTKGPQLDQAALNRELYTDGDESPDRID